MTFMTLSDLTKYSATKNVARSLCDNWATCFQVAPSGPRSPSVLRRPFWPHRVARATF